MDFVKTFRWQGEKRIELCASSCNTYTFSWELGLGVLAQAAAMEAEEPSTITNSSH